MNPQQLRKVSAAVSVEEITPSRSENGNILARITKAFLSIFKRKTQRDILEKSSETLALPAFVKIKGESTPSTSTLTTSKDWASRISKDSGVSGLSSNTGTSSNPPNRNGLKPPGLDHHPGAWSELNSIFDRDSSMGSSTNEPEVLVQQHITMARKNSAKLYGHDQGSKQNRHHRAKNHVDEIAVGMESTSP
ncbi:hypothetical protein EJ08DRAFT_694258 [Tothia fuscella]|uniref:Uncharacterized protein n=1 Tax=Tothia fuscella TaxID=1048955 RepID=A0A9P4U2B1_9PEZI|nr:hypothetical protein EJ08DRAFT_694258 [Tothia fuscella]